MNGANKMNEREILERLDNLRKRIDGISSADDMPEFMGMLVTAWNDGAFEDQDIEEYLNGVWGVIEGNAVSHKGQPPLEPTWRLFAEILFRAFAHS